jgi:hypothetical protein
MIQLYFSIIIVLINYFEISFSTDSSYYQDISYRSVFNNNNNNENVSPSWTVLPFTLSKNKNIISSITLNNDNNNCILALSDNNKIFGSSRKNPAPVK